MTDKTAFHHGNLKAALIDHSLQILANEGVEGLTLRKAARHAGVSEAAPYRHFKDKDALLAAIATQGFLKLATELEQVEQLYEDDARRLFRESCLAYIRFAQSNPDSMRIMFRSRNRAGDSSYPDLQEAADEVFNYLIDTVEFCQHADIAPDGHPLPLALSAWSTLHGLAMLLIGNCISPTVFSETNQNELIEKILDSIIAGWQAAATG
ncbi:MAG: TetR/AcrR family transcriptional regulator [Verrucomicrobiae bacterium]|nr:TetR/AcrR family transcriptional regulator [Verrucomicrobiae bacterium]